MIKSNNPHLAGGMNCNGGAHIDNTDTDTDTDNDNDDDK